MTNIGFEIVVILLLILANGAFSMSELAIISARKSRLRHSAETGDRRAKVALELAEDPNRFLSTVQVGITVVGTLAGVFGGATIAEHLAGVLATIPALAPYASGLGLGIVVVILSYLTLILGELVPKRLAMSNPERIASRVAVPLRWVSVAGVPLVRLLSWSTDLILRILGVGGVEESAVTEEEVQGLIRQGTELGVFETAEHDIVRRAFRLDDHAVRLMMTRRSEIVWIEANEPPEEIRRKALESPHSRFPVCDGSLDRVLGIVQAKDLLARGLDGQSLNLKGLVKLPLLVFDGMSGLKVLERFKSSAMPMAIVLDEYGTVQGLLTLNDILEALVGEIPTVEGETDQRAVQRPDGSWLLDGMLPVAELRDLVTLPPMPQGDYDTLAGFILLMLDRIPAVADRFEWGGHRFEVVDMDDRRIDRVLVSKVCDGEPAE